MRLVEFPLESGGSIVVEVEDRMPSESVVRRGIGQPVRPGEIAVKAGQTLESAFSRIQPAAVAMVAKLRDLMDAPDEIEIHFGIQLSAEVGAIVAHTAGEANFNVRLTWKRDGDRTV